MNRVSDKGISKHENRRINENKNDVARRTNSASSSNNANGINRNHKHRFTFSIFGLGKRKGSKQAKDAPKNTKPISQIVSKTKPAESKESATKTEYTLSEYCDMRGVRLVPEGVVKSLDQKSLLTISRDSQNVALIRDTIDPTTGEKVFLRVPCSSDEVRILTIPGDDKQVYIVLPLGKEKGNSDTLDIGVNANDLEENMFFRENRIPILDIFEKVNYEGKVFRDSFANRGSNVVGFKVSKNGQYVETINRDNSEGIRAQLDDVMYQCGDKEGQHTVIIPNPNDKDNPIKIRYENKNLLKPRSDKKNGDIWKDEKYMPPMGQLPKFYTTDGRCLTFERINKSDIQVTLDTGESCLCPTVEISLGEKPDELYVTIRSTRYAEIKPEPIQMTIKRSEWYKYEHGKREVSDNPTMSVYMYRNDALPLSDKSRDFESVDGHDKFTISPTGGIKAKIRRIDPKTNKSRWVMGKCTWDDAKISDIPNNDSQVEVEFLITRGDGKKSPVKMVMNKDELLKYQSEKSDAPSLKSFLKQEGGDLFQSPGRITAEDGKYMMFNPLSKEIQIVLDPSKSIAAVTNSTHSILQVPNECVDLIRVIHGPGPNQVTVVVPNLDGIKNKNIDPDNLGSMPDSFYFIFNELEINRYRDLSNAQNL